MKLFISFILIITSINVTAQNWFPFPLGQKSYFQYNGIYMNGNDTSINIYYCDSLKNSSNNKTFLFDYSTPDFLNCYEHIDSYPNIYQMYYDYVRPDSLIQKNDSLYLMFSNHNPNTFKDSILFLPQAKKNSSWFSSIDGTGYNRIKFTCDSIYYDTLVNGIMDSLKLFSLQTYNNGNPIASGLDSLTLILSKNYGFKQFISFHNVHKETELIGLDSSTIHYGFTQPQFLDYFHLNIGDIIIWKEHYSSHNPMNQSYTLYIKDSITNVISTSDSVIYSSYRTYTGQSFIMPSGVLKNYKNKLKGLTLSTAKKISCQSINFWNQNEEIYSSSNIYLTNDTIVNRNYVFDGFTIDTSNCSINTIYDNGYRVEYNTYYGLKSFSLFSYGDTYSWTIEGSVINGVQTGNVWNVGINENSLAQNFEIYPNPTDGIFKVKGKNIDKIEVFNISGNLIQSQMVKNTINHININNQPKGFYFIKAFFKSGASKVEKLIFH